MSFKISADTGGTFTDVVISDAAGGLTIGKSLTTPDRAYDGLSAAMRSAAAQLGESLEGLLANTTSFVYGTTRSTNAIVTKSGAKTAFLTTDGFKDTLLLKEGGKSNPHDFSRDFPQPYIPRRHTFGIRERMGSEGTASIPLDEGHVRDLIQYVKDQGFEAIGVSLLWSIVNPAHELRIGEIISEIAPDMPFTLGHQLVPIVREYRRASATCIDASMKPLMQGHLRQLEADLKQAGYRGELLISTSAGGCMHAADVIQKPIHTAKSGPSMAPVAARSFSEVEGKGGDIIVCDTGGTTFDVGLVIDSKLVYSRDTWLGGNWTGHLLGISSVDIRSVGAGGGSIAWIDDGGLLRVGPQSAGSVPGPACYGRGGDRATVSDAACVLKYLDPENFLGGRMKLDAGAATRVVAHLAKQLGQSIEETAYGVIRLASQVMIGAIRDITISKGIDPRSSIVVAGGGAAGINIGLIAQELGVDQVLIPKQASALSACGMQFADIVTEETSSCLTSSASFDVAGASGTLQSLTARLEAFRQSLSPDLRAKEHLIQFSVDARYSSQTWDIPVNFGAIDFAREGVCEELYENFHRAHERIYALRDEGSVIEFLNWNARLIVHSGIKLSGGRTEGGGTDKPLVRDCYFGAATAVPTSIHSGNSLAVGARIQGPGIIVEPTTTIVIYPGMSVSVTSNGHYLLNFDEGGQ